MPVSAAEDALLGAAKERAPESGVSTVLEEEIDSDYMYEPTQAEIAEYATWLGMDVATDAHLLWVAREGLKAPLPWKPCKSPDGEIYYFNFSTGESVWDHPCDEHYKAKFEEEKKKANRTAE